ncbi:MAG TPA: hypothetical protein DEG32_05685, partial [Balneolaceae bacterium]|nr:hypothetical protein [Balneolaceae bacterium]
MKYLDRFSRLLFKVIIVALLLPISYTTVQAQSMEPAIEFIKQFKGLQDQLPRESVYLHTDRDWYY